MTCHSVSNSTFICRSPPWGTSPFFPLLCLSLYSHLLSSWLPSFTPSFSSHPALNSPFQFQNALKPAPATGSPSPSSKTELWDSLPFFLLFIFLLTVSSILSTPSQPGPAYLAQFLFLLAVLFLLEELVSGQGWSKSFVTIPCWASPSLHVWLF